MTDRQPPTPRRGPYPRAVPDLPSGAAARSRTPGPPASGDDGGGAPGAPPAGRRPGPAGLFAVLLAGASALTLAGLVLLTSCGSPGRQRVGPYDEALRQVNERGGRLAWDGLVTGMTFDGVERTVGQRLGRLSGPGPLCGRYTVEATVLGQRLELGFGGPTGAATLESITLLLPAPPGGLDRDDVVPALEARLGELEWIPSRHAPERGEDEVRNPLYRTASGGLVFVDADRGVALGDVCYD